MPESSSDFDPINADGIIGDVAVKATDNLASPEPLPPNSADDDWLDFIDWDFTSVEESISVESPALSPQTGQPAIEAGVIADEPDDQPIAGTAGQPHSHDASASIADDAGVVSSGPDAGTSPAPESEQCPGPAGSGAPGSVPASTVLINMLSEITYFHSPAGKPYAVIAKNGGSNVLPLRSTTFTRYAKARYFQSRDKPIPSSAFQDALDVLEAWAMDGPEEEIHIRVAYRDETIYVDLANAAHEVVVITAHGWQISTTCDMRFSRAQSMAAMPKPVSGGNLTNLLRPYCKCRERRSRPSDRLASLAVSAGRLVSDFADQR